MKCKNVRDWKEDENSKHISLTSSLRNWNWWQRSLTCHGMEVVVFNSHAIIIAYMHGVRWQRKIETKIVTALIFSHSGNLKNGIKCQGLNYKPPPPPHPAATYHWFCQLRSLTGYATVFFCCCCFLSMEFIAELPFKSLRFSWCFHTVFCFTIILTAV